MNLIRLKYPGYYYDKDTDILYTLKVTGVLRTLKVTTFVPFIVRKTRGIYGNPPYYSISFEGKRRWLFVHDLKAGKYNSTNEDNIISLPIEISKDK